MAKGNQCINKSIAKEVEHGKIIQDIPEIEHNGEMFPLFTVIPPTHCFVCGNKLRPNENYDQFTSCILVFHDNPVNNMAEIKGAKKALEKGGNDFRGVMDKNQSAEDTIDDSVQKVTSPIDQKQSQLDSALSKVDEPFEAMEDKQMQANNAVNASKEKADAASKLLDAKELAHQEGANKTNDVMSGAKTRANRATSSIEDRQLLLQLGCKCDFVI